MCSILGLKRVRSLTLTKDFCRPTVRALNPWAPFLNIPCLQLSLLKSSRILFLIMKFNNFINLGSINETSLRLWLTVLQLSRRTQTLMHSTRISIETWKRKLLQIQVKELLKEARSSLIWPESLIGLKNISRISNLYKTFMRRSPLL